MRLCGIMALYVTLVPRGLSTADARTGGAALMNGEAPDTGRVASLPNRKSRWRSFCIASLRLIILGLAGFVVVLYLIQDRVIFPGAATQGSPEAIVHPSPGSELLELRTRGGQRVVALYGSALSTAGRPLADAQARPVLLYFYGNAMCLASAQYDCERFRRLGLNVMVPDYLGYGLSDGTASERGCRETAEACLEALEARGFGPERIIASGWSLGGAVAIDLASRHRVAGLVAFCTFTSAHDMARSILPLPLPSFMLAHKFDSLSKMPSITCPMLLAHGRRDPIVPFPMFERLAKAATARVTTLVIDKAGHNDFYELGGSRIDEAIVRFVEQVRG
jgi:pimeloyl-ACP methyl ester carboxylesterase